MSKLGGGGVPAATGGGLLNKLGSSGNQNSAPPAATGSLMSKLGGGNL